MITARPVVAGTLLALLSYAGDDIDLGLDLTTAQVLSQLTSSGLVWGAAC